MPKMKLHGLGDCKREPKSISIRIYGDLSNANRADSDSDDEVDSIFLVAFLVPSIIIVIGVIAYNRLLLPIGSCS